MRKKYDNFDYFVDKLVKKHPRFKPLKSIYVQYKEMLLYAFFGIGTVAISIVSYGLFTEVVALPILLANAISWIFATTFAFLTNRTWVFTSHKRGVTAFFVQMISFFFGRFLTLMIEEGMLYYFVARLEYANMLIKAISQVVVIVSNYIISKLLVFRRKSSAKR